MPQSLILDDGERDLYPFAGRESLCQAQLDSVLNGKYVCSRLCKHNNQNCKLLLTYLHACNINIICKTHITNLKRRRVVVNQTCPDNVELRNNMLPTKCEKIEPTCM
jgi:hypothetical protein